MLAKSERDQEKKAEREMAVIRVNKTADYTVMSNTHFREKGMSLKAKGILSLMLSLPDSWDYSVAGLTALSKDGKDSVMGALNELEQFGYLIRARVNDEKGRFAGYDYDIYENPQSGKPKEVEPYSGNPNTDNPSQYNTKQSNTKQSNTYEIKDKKERKKGTSFDTLIEQYSNGDDEVKEWLGEWLKVRKAKRAAMTDKAIELNLQKVYDYARQSNMTVVAYLQEVVRKGWVAFYPIEKYSNPKQERSIMDDYNDMNEIIEGGLFK